MSDQFGFNISADSARAVVVEEDCLEQRLQRPQRRQVALEEEEVCSAEEEGAEGCSGDWVVNPTRRTLIKTSSVALPPSVAERQRPQVKETSFYSLVLLISCFTVVYDICYI